jgi:hypothetical protein
LSNFVSSYRLILIRGGGFRNDSQHDSEFPSTKEKVKESTEGTSKHRVEIDSSAERILRGSFSWKISLIDIIFASDWDLKEIDGFDQCRSLHRIEIPSSVELISENGFLQCTSLNEILFISDC